MKRRGTLVAVPRSAMTSGMLFAGYLRDPDERARWLLMLLSYKNYSERWGGTIIFSSGDANYSVSDLLIGGIGGGQGSNQLAAPVPAPQFRRPSDYIRRNRCDLDTVRAIVARFHQCRVLVAGDLIVDEYVECEALGMSREDPTIVVSSMGLQRFLGGAGIVAAHAQALGASAHFLGLFGEDKAGAFASGQLEAHGVVVHRFTDQTRPTTVKRRYRCEGKTLLRVSRLSQDDAPAAVLAGMLEAVRRELPDMDCVVLSDFSYGCLAQPLVDAMLELAAAHGITSAADSQSSSQTGDVSRFRGASLLCATEHEARIAMRAPATGLSALGVELINRAQAQSLFLKLGGAGLVLLAQGDNPSDLERLPALNPHPVDVAGAGDSMLIAATLALAAGATPAQAAYIGSIAAAIQVSRLGNIPLTFAELNRALH